MKTISKILLVFGALSILLLFVSPMWKIYLAAPQYPEGLEMHIWINKIGGNNEFVLQNFNILNHYIGMAAIQEDSFKELVIMPYIAIFFVVSGLAVAFLNRKKLVIVWAALLMISGGIGLLDFNHWLHEFGTNLDPKAPIKVPGMTYIPPFIGSKNLLNFQAFSTPWYGSLGLFIPVLMAAVVLFLERKKSKKKSRENRTGEIRSYSSAAIIITLLTLSSCSSEPREINYGTDQCHFCKMTVTDAAYGAQLVTSKGKNYVFDAVECLGRYVNDEGISETENKFLVSDYASKTLVPATSAHFLHSENLPSPMGMNLTAFANENNAEEALKEKGGVVMTWQEVLQLLK